MSAENIASYISAKTLLGSIGENHRYIKELLLTKVSTIEKVQSAMDKKARTKTPLNERQQCVFYDFIGLYAKEGGSLKKSLVRMEHVQHIIHTENTQPFILSLLLLERHQHDAIKSLRRMIASGQKTLSNL